MSCVRRRHLVISLIAIFAVSVPASPGSATTLTDLSLEDLVSASDSVVVGTVLEVEALGHGPAGQPGIHTRARIAVDETLLGPPESDQLDVWVQGGRLGDQMRVIPGQARFRVGETVVLFLFQAGGGLWPTGMARGKWRVDRGSPGLVVEPPDGVRSSSGSLSSSELVVRVAAAASDTTNALGDDRVRQQGSLSP